MEWDIVLPILASVGFGLAGGEVSNWLRSRRDIESEQARWRRDRRADAYLELLTEATVMGLQAKRGVIVRGASESDVAQARFVVRAKVFGSDAAFALAEEIVEMLDAQPTDHGAVGARTHELATLVRAELQADRG